MRNFVFLLFILVASGCSKKSEEIIVYTSHDRNLSEPILTMFEKETGVEVKAVYDIEANKSTGLVNRLIAEKEHPRADVFWNNEHLRTIKLKEAGILQEYQVGTKSTISGFSDPEGYWTGFAARGRVLIVNNDLVPAGDEPAGLNALTEKKWQGKVAIADPHFGTTGTHFSALFKLWGADKFKAWLVGLRANDVAVLPGNGQVKDAVAAGRYWLGLTDTDDVNGAIRDGKPVRLVLPDQGHDGLGMMLIPNSIALIKGAPHPETARRFIDFILSKRIEALLARQRGAQIPIIYRVPGPSIIPSTQKIRLMKVDNTAQAAEQLRAMLEIYRSVFHQDPA